MDPERYNYLLSSSQERASSDLWVVVIGRRNPSAVTSFCFLLLFVVYCYRDKLGFDSRIGCQSGVIEIVAEAEPLPHQCLNCCRVVLLSELTVQLLEIIFSHRIGCPTVFNQSRSSYDHQLSLRKLIKFSIIILSISKRFWIFAPLSTVKG